MAIWLESKLGDVSYFSGHFLNDHPCGYRSFLGPFGEENSTCVSYETQPDGTYKPLVVHYSWHHVHDTYGHESHNNYVRGKSITNDSFFVHPRLESVVLCRFATYLDADVIQCLFDEARETMGRARQKAPSIGRSEACDSGTLFLEIRIITQNR